MKPLLIALGLGLFAIGLHAAPPHPTLLTTKYKNLLLPVIKIIGTDPVVLVDGKEKRIRQKTVYIPQRADHYSREFVEIPSLKIVTNQSQAYRSDFATQGMVHVEAEFRSRNTLRGAYLLITVSKPAVDVKKQTLIQTEFVAFALPELRAGEVFSLKQQLAVPNAINQMDSFMQLFDADGLEIPTDKLDDVWAYYALLEKTQLASVIQDYRKQFADADHEVFPVVRPKPLLTPGLTAPQTPATAMLTVSADGLVTEVVLSGIENPDVQACVETALGGWLFLPLLKAGQPVPSRVQIPIQF